MTNKTLSFSRTDSANFFRTLNKRVNSYFKENKIKQFRQFTDAQKIQESLN